MQRAPCIFRAHPSICPMRVRSKTALKRFNVEKYRAAQIERRNDRNALESGPVDLHSLALKFPPQVTPEFVLRNGWCPPPEKQPDLPFQVTRTGHGGFIPVYRDIRNGGTRVVTVVRKVSGDLETFTADLSKVCQSRNVEARGGTLQVTGDHVTNVKRWLAGLGF